MRYFERLLAIGWIALGICVPAIGYGMDASDSAQETCPVMEGNRIDPDIYVDYQGRRVYFCCQVCKGAFEKEPEKYLPKLPQFAASHVPASTEHGSHDHGEEPAAKGLRLYRFTEPLGITTFSFLALTVCAGLLRRKLKRRFLRIHKVLAFTTVGLAVLHVLTVLLGH